VVLIEEERLEMGFKYLKVFFGILIGENGGHFCDNYLLL